MIICEKYNRSGAWDHVTDAEKDSSSAMSLVGGALDLSAK